MNHTSDCPRRGSTWLSVYPNTPIQTCMVHLIRHALAFAHWKERKSLADALKPLWTIFKTPKVPTMIYTTHAIESLHRPLRKIVKNRAHFPNDEPARKLLFLALRNIEKNWKMPPITWKQADNPFAFLFGERFTNPIK